MVLYHIYLKWNCVIAKILIQVVVVAVLYVWWITKKLICWECFLVVVICFMWCVLILGWEWIWLALFVGRHTNQYNPLLKSMYVFLFRFIFHKFNIWYMEIMKLILDAWTLMYPCKLIIFLSSSFVYKNLLFEVNKWRILIPG
jgi:hypothetical protein